MEAGYGGTDVMERSCAVARGTDINNMPVNFTALKVNTSTLDCELRSPLGAGSGTEIIQCCAVPVRC
jgi:hypothetical protein